MLIPAISLAAHIGIALGVTITLVLTFPIIVPLVFGVRGAPQSWQDRVTLRYQRQRSIPPWIYAWFKLRLDPMFRELPDILKSDRPPMLALDLGCGWGVAGCALLEWFPQLELHAIEPARLRSRMAERLFGGRGHVHRGGAPHALAEAVPSRFDVVFMLDVTHLMTDDALTASLGILREKLIDGGMLVARVNVPQPRRQSLIWRLDWLHRTLTRARTFHRPVERSREILESAGFDIIASRRSGGKAEMVWLIATASSRRLLSRDTVSLCATNRKN